MRFQKAIKRIVALGTGALMLSSAYAAADLSTFPAPFIKDGKFSGVLVVGDKATAEDVIGITDVMGSLQAASVKAVSGSGGSVDLEAAGDAWKVGTSTKIMELTQIDSAANRESIATITSSSFIDDAELPGLLAGGTLSNSKGTATYEQRLYFEDITTGYVLYTESDDDMTADFLYFPNGKQIARYEMEFTTQLESDVDNSAGSADQSGTYLTDMEDVELSMLGKTFQIVTARRVSGAGSSAVLTLMGGAKRDTLLEGNTKTYTVDGKDYEVTLNFVDSDEAQFVVNGQTTRKMQDGDTDKLSDGTTMGVSEILYQDYAGGIHSATFFLGAQKVELRDTLILDTTSSTELKVDDETIDGVDVTIEGTDDNSTFRLESISLNVSADDNFFVPAGGKLSEAMSEAGAEADALFTRNWDIEYKGLSKVATSEISVKASGSDDYSLTFTDGRGNQVKLPLANSDGASSIRFGSDDDDLHVWENGTISKDDYFVITDETDTDGERQTFALKYTGADKSTSDNPVIKFKDLGSSDAIERPFSATGSVVDGFATQVGEIKLGGGTYKIYNTSSTLSNDFNIVVDLDADGTLTRQRISINTKDGARIDVYNQSNASLVPGIMGNNDGFIVNISTPNADDYDDVAPAFVLVNITADSSGEVRMARMTASTYSFKSPEDDDDNEYAYSSMGAKIRYYSPSSDPQELIVEYPVAQSTPLVYVTGKDVSFTETASSGSTGAVQVQRIAVGAAKLASEVSDVKAQNTILVGGPCANAAAAAVMGNPADCVAGFEPGVGKIQLFEHANGNVAMLVAGYSGVDTRNAAQVVANYKDYKAQLTGTSVEVKKVNNQLTVAKPAPAAVMEDDSTEETA